MKTEIFTLYKMPDGTMKSIIFRYDEPTLFDIMLSRFRKWEAEGKLDIIEVR